MSAFALPGESRASTIRIKKWKNAGRQLKNGQLNEMSASVRNVNKMCFYALC